MSETISIMFDENGKAKIYDDTFDITIHCENEEEQNKVLEILNRRWIPVSEKLPEEEKRLYWVCTDTGYQCQCRWTNDIYGLGESDRWGWKIFDIPQYQKVIAWMPLPEPYKAESEVQND